MGDLQLLLAGNAPAPAARWTGFPPYDFTGGHNDPDAVPVAALAETALRVITEAGRELATYNAAGPLGHGALRTFVAAKLRAQRGIEATVDDVLITSGSLQGLDLVNELLLEPGDTVIVEEFTYGGMLSRLARRGVRVVGAPLDAGGIDMAALAAILDRLKREGVKPKYVYTIPTVQNPTATVMAVERRTELLRLAEAHGFVVFEDECYADLLWEGAWPPALAGLATTAPVIHIGSFSKSLAPALRLGYVHASWDVLGRIQALKTDAGTPLIEQMIVADYFGRLFEPHVRELKAALQAKCEVLMAALAEEFGTAAEFAPPPGGIFLWVKLPAEVDTAKLAAPALAEGVAYNPGAEWATAGAPAGSSLRLCYARPSLATIRDGIAKLAEVCHRETGLPVRSGNRPRHAHAR